MSLKFVLALVNVVTCNGRIKWKQQTSNKEDVESNLKLS